MIDSVLTQIARQFVPVPPVTGSIAPASAAAFDHLVELLRTLGPPAALPTRQALILADALDAIATLVPDASDPTPWTFQREPGPAGGILTLARSGPFPLELTFQTDRGHQPHGAFTFVHGRQELTFDLHQEVSGWSLRRWQVTSPQCFPLQLPGGRTLRWSLTVDDSFWKQLHSDPDDVVNPWSAPSDAPTGSPPAPAALLREPPPPAIPDSSTASPSSVSEPRTCTQCGSALLPHARFCTSCRCPVPPADAPAPSPRFCNRCGAPCTVGARFCTACRHKLQ